jgi:hypothetical protein
MSSSAAVIPAQLSCPCCHRPCVEDGLSYCYTCGDKFCGRRNCPTMCSCDYAACDLLGLSRKPTMLECLQLWFRARRA